MFGSAQKAERGNAASKSLPEAYRKIDNFEQERRFGLKAESDFPIISDNPMAAFGRLLSYREPARRCRAAFPSCGIPQGGQPTAWEYSVKKTMARRNGRFFDFYHADIRMQRACGGAALKAVPWRRRTAHYEPPAFRTPSFTRTPL